MPRARAEVPTRPSAPLNLALPATRRRSGPLLLSVALHAVLIAFLIHRGERIWSRTLAPGDPALPRGGGGGGSGATRVAYITLPPIAPAVAPQPEPVPPPVHPRKVEPVSAAKAPPPPKSAPPVDSAPPVALRPAPAADVSGTGPGTGGGNGGGEGPGVGPGGGGGEGGMIRPPELRDLAFPFDTPPKELRGASVRVTFWVRVDGRVERYETEPAIRDRDYARKFDEVIRSFRFTPARAPDGTHVAGTYTATFTLPGKHSS